MFWEYISTICIFDRIFLPMPFFRCHILYICVVEMGHNCFKLSYNKAMFVLSSCASLNRSYETSKNVIFLMNQNGESQRRCWLSPKNSQQFRGMSLAYQSWQHARAQLSFSILWGCICINSFGTTDQIYKRDPEKTGCKITYIWVPSLWEALFTEAVMVSETTWDLLLLYYCLFLWAFLSFIHRR